MDIRRLEYFVGVVESGSQSAAAHRMAISQPSLSRQISLFEEELGVKLFYRQRRGVALTQEGQALYQRINHHLKEISKALRETRSAAGSRRETVVLWVPQNLEPLLAAPLTRRFAAFAPEISLRLSGGPKGTIANLIRRGEFDMGLVYGPPEAWERMEWRRMLPDLAQKSILQEELVLIGPADSHLSADTPISAAALARLPLVVPSHANMPPNFINLLPDIADRRIVRDAELFESDSVQQTREMVMSGLAYAMVSKSTVLDDLRAGKLRFAPIAGPDAILELILVYRRETMPSDRQTKAIALLLDEVRELVAGEDWPAQILF